MTGTTAGSMPVSRSAGPTIVPETVSSPPLAIPRQPVTESIMTSSSFASQDTFMTALTSSQAPSSPTTSRMHSASPHSLRKSISVDSFITNRRSPDLSEAGPSSGGHSREYERESGQSGAYDWSIGATSAVANVSRAVANKSLASRFLGRTRGYSLSNPSPSDYNDPYLDDSDHERVIDMDNLSFRPPHRSHSASASATNGFGKGKAKARPVDVLLVPPRTASASGAASLNGVPNGATFAADVPPVPRIPNLHHRRPNPPGSLVMPRRSRSSSLDVVSVTGFSSNVALQFSGVFTIAVVGPPACGKTTLIKKGLRSWGVSEESICTVATPRGRLRYGCRTINAPRNEGLVAHVLEVDSDALHLDSPNGAWPDELPPVDGLLVCYDVSEPVSFVRIPDLLACYNALHLPVIAMSCKCDLEKKVLPRYALDRVGTYDVGLVEVTSLTDPGKRKMRDSFQWIIRAAATSRRSEAPPGSTYQNPASPDVLNTPPWSEGYDAPDTRARNGSMSTTSTGSPSSATRLREHPFATPMHVPTSPTPGSSTPTPRSPSKSTSPMRVKSTNDLYYEIRKGRQEMQRDSLDGRGGVLGRRASVSTGSLHETFLNNEKEETGPMEGNGGGDHNDKPPEKSRDPPPVVWATLEELLDQLFYSAVSGDDPTLIKYFFLIYRRFATPRSILLGMQKRVRQLNHEHADPFLGYAQMRICDLLEGWVEDYPTDFATPGTAGAITALVKQISSHVYTLHYGSSIIPFLDELPNLQDVDASWSLHEDVKDDSDDEAAGLLEDEEEEGWLGRHVASTTKTTPVANPNIMETKPKLTTRERKGSLLLSTNSSAIPLSTTLSGSSDASNRIGANLPKRNSPRELVKLAQTLATYDSLDIAQQITKMQSEMFLAIEPRQWLRYTMGDAKTCPGDPITASANFYNQLANWVSSLILAHDKVRHRERQVERFIELVAKLRTLNNYSGLRAVKTGINNATYPNDEIMMMLRDNKPKLYRQFLGWEILLNSVSNHRAYRMAIKNTSGPGIPDMEVHTFDMVRAHDSNVDRKSDDSSKIHWGKFTLMARMIVMLQGLQDKIRCSGQYDFPERQWIREMVNNDVMDVETIRSRVFPPPDDAEPILSVSRQSVDSPNAARTDAKLKRLIFW